MKRRAIPLRYFLLLPEWGATGIDGNRRGSTGIDGNRGMDEEAGGSKSKSPSPSMSTVSCPEYPELQDKLHRLAMARDSLSLQVTVLTEQVGAQKEKIRDLETQLESKRNKLESAEELLHDVTFENRGDLELKKLDLQAEVGQLKMKFSALERDKTETERKLRTSQAEIDHLNQSLHGMMTHQGLHAAVNPYSHQFVTPHHPVNVVDPSGEMEQLRLAVQRLLAENEQKNMQIEALRGALDDQQSREQEMTIIGNAYNSPSLSIVRHSPFEAQQQPPFDINAQLRKLLSSLCSTVPHPSRTPSAIQSSSSYTSSLSTASPQHSWSASGTPRHQSLFPPGFPQPQQRQSPAASPAARQLAAELDELRRIGGDAQAFYSTASLPRPLPSKTQPTLTLPRKKLSVASSTGGSGGEFALPPRAASSVGRGPRPASYKTSFNRWISDKLGKASNRCTSAPNLVESDDELTRNRGERLSIAGATSGKFKRDRGRSSLRNLLGKLTRSTSQEMHAGTNGQSHTGEFRRGSAIRSTASARLASLGPLPGSIPLRPSIHHFLEWPSEQLCEWMAEIGFSQYVPEVARVVRSGRHLLSMSPQELEKEVGMKNALHRKRLRSILHSIDRGTKDPADKMDTHQVMRWLDDIGLPQYRDLFAENLIDGQMLVLLTAQDLVELRITSALHHATIARGIQYLRSIDFFISRLERRFNPDLLQRCPCPNEVERWTQHCICEWLKTIDLAEFTPNLLCAGIHGALMVHEATFTAECLAEVLQMPAHKTLLRRHLTTHFNQLIGQAIIGHKRDVLAQPYVAQLLPSLKIRLLKKGFSLSRKKTKNEVYVEPDELVCPAGFSKGFRYPQIEQISENILDNLTASNV